MARPSKSSKYALHQDTSIPTPDSSNQPSFDDAIESHARWYAGSANDYDNAVPNQSLETEIEIEGNDEGLEADDERRVSTCARISISSLPESTNETDHERSRQFKPSYSSPMIRPSFRRPESVRRMQMTSPGPFDRSPRRAATHQVRSRAGTPRSVRSSARGSPRPRRAIDEDIEIEEEKEYPLVLLHVTLLPVELRWSMASMEELLPADTLENMRLLRSKISETILHRGILIPHPREEYEMLEERLLEALEFKAERVTKCGHFRARDSISSAESGAADSDSGLGSSVEDADEELCCTCHHRVKGDSGVSDGTRKWSMKVFAANGLMRASAWSAAWSEMERVDVEMLPWISEDLRRKLDDRRVLEEAFERAREAEQQVVHIAEEHDFLARERRPKASRNRTRTRKVSDIPPISIPTVMNEDTAKAPSQQQTDTIPQAHDYKQHDLPQIYHPKDIPLSVLVSNYLYLLAQDKKNVAIFVLVLLGCWLGLGMAFKTTGNAELVMFTNSSNASLTMTAFHGMPTVESMSPMPHHSSVDPETRTSMTQSLVPTESPDTQLNASTERASVFGNLISSIEDVREEDSGGTKPDAESPEETLVQSATDAVIVPEIEDVLDIVE